MPTQIVAVARESIALAFETLHCRKDRICGRLWFLGLRMEIFRSATLACRRGIRNRMSRLDTVLFCVNNQSGAPTAYAAELENSIPENEGNDGPTMLMMLWRQQRGVDLNK